MARINIEDSIYKDQRFIDLIIATGGLETALGALIRVWSVSQRFYLQNGGKIPLPEWKEQKLNDKVIECGLAIYADDFIIVKGVDKQFAWLRQRSDCGKIGGPAASRARLENIKELERRNTSEHVGSRPLTLSLSPTLTQIQKQREIHISSGDDAHVIFEIWNKNRNTLPEVKAISKQRKQKALARWKEKPDPIYWTEVVSKLANSNFCSGNNSTGWVANIDFLLRPETHLKTIEGNYDNRGSVKNNNLVADIITAIEQEERGLKND